MSKASKLEYKPEGTIFWRAPYRTALKMITCGRKDTSHLQVSCISERTGQLGVIVMNDNEKILIAEKD